MDNRDLKILSWNINGLRAVLRRQFGSVSNLLGKLKADIICFQETKLTKADFDRDLAIVEGWYALYSEWSKPENLAHCNALHWRSDSSMYC